MADNYLKWSIPSACQLGEGPYYQPRQQRLYWVDIKGRAIFHSGWGSGNFQRIATAEPVGWLLPTKDKEWLAGMGKRICRLHSTSFKPVEMLALDEPPTNRLNDAKADRTGQLYFGTMDDAEQQSSGNLYRWKNSQAPEIVDDGYVVSNGPAFSLDGRVLYTASSSERIIYRMQVDADNKLSQKQEFIHFSQEMGFPDGMTVDAQNHLWVAAWGGFAVYRFSPTGEKVAKLTLPVPLITSLTFAGPDYRYLAVTSARVSLSPSELARYPHSGHVFILDPGVRGVAEKPLNL